MSNKEHRTSKARFFTAFRMTERGGGVGNAESFGCAQDKRRIPNVEGQCVSGGRGAGSG
jgi:hypothetical protein